jgi:two-component system OmpR family response regulator
LLHCVTCRLDGRTPAVPYSAAMDRPDHVLVVDDDAEIRKLLGEYLQRSGFRVSLATDGREMRRVLENSRPDIVVLDLMLPGDSGLTLCRDLRADSNLPVIMLTARAEEVDRIVGLEMGADDYLAKPFSPRELLARINSILRRARGLAPVRGDAQRLRFAGWTLELAARQLVAPDGVVVALSGAEYRLLTVFLEHPNRVLDRNQLMDLTLGRDGTPFDRSIDVQVSRLRMRLREDAREPRIIKTVRSEGYVLAAAVERLA